MEWSCAVWKEVTTRGGSDGFVCYSCSVGGGDGGLAGGAVVVVVEEEVAEKTGLVEGVVAWGF